MMRRAILTAATMALTLLVASGVALAVTRIGTLRGTNGGDNLFGKGGNHVLFALRGNGNLLGGEGKDWLLTGERRALGGDKNSAGGPGNDGVAGGLGSDAGALSASRMQGPNTRCCGDGQRCEIVHEIRGDSVRLISG
jgi:Ca2+-binding RTX toxin-like protein